MCDSVMQLLHTLVGVRISTGKIEFALCDLHFFILLIIFSSGPKYLFLYTLLKNKVYLLNPYIRHLNVKKSL